MSNPRSAAIDRMLNIIGKATPLVSTSHADTVAVRTCDVCKSARLSAHISSYRHGNSNFFHDFYYCNDVQYCGEEVKLLKSDTGTYHFNASLPITHNQNRHWIVSSGSA